MGQSADANAEDTATSTEDIGLAYDLWRTKCWRLFPLLTIYVISLTFLAPVKPMLMTGKCVYRESWAWGIQNSANVILIPLSTIVLQIFLHQDTLATMYTVKSTTLGKSHR